MSTSALAIMLTTRRAIHKIEIERGRGRDYRHHEVEALLAMKADIDSWLAENGVPDWRHRYA